MHSKLLYFILLVNTGLLLASCRSDAPDDENLERGSEMEFLTAEISRATSMSDLNYEGSEFYLYGKMKFLDHDPTILFNKTGVRHNGGRWSYGNTQYWYPKHEFSFIALHPVGATGVSDPEYDGSQISFTHTLPNNFAYANDLMVATHRRLYEEQDLSSHADPVTLRFWHILSRVNFIVKNDGAADRMRVTKITLEGVNKTGTFTVAPAPLLSGSGQTDDYIYSWTNVSNPETITANIGVDILEDEQQPLFPDNNSLFAIPQPDNKGIKVTITYTLYDANAQPEELTLTAEAAIGGWEAGKIYTYSTAISEITKEIYLTVGVKDWHKPVNNNITVPES